LGLLWSAPVGNGKNEKDDDKVLTGGLLKALLVPAIVGLIGIVLWLTS
jgi:hypothetical protein